MKQTEREPLLTDIIAMFVGVGGIAVGYLRQFNDIRYLPGDVRAEPWFDPAFAVIATIGGLFIFLIGSIRLLQGLRARRK